MGASTKRVARRLTLTAIVAGCVVTVAVVAWTRGWIPTPVRFVAERIVLRPDGHRLRVTGVYTYRNPYARPRAWIAESAVFQPTHSEAVVALVQLGALEDIVLITGMDEPVEGIPGGAAPRAEVRDLSPNAVEVRLPQGGGFL